MPTLEHKLFGRAEFASLLKREAERCRRIARERYCVGVLPPRLLFHAKSIDWRSDRISEPGVLRVPGRTVLELEHLPAHLWRDDGRFRRWIDLSPEAVTDDATVLDVCWADDWTDALFVGDGAFPGEPFKLGGPALPPGWREGIPIPRLQLPRLQFVSDSYEWPGPSL